MGRIGMRRIEVIRFGIFWLVLLFASSVTAEEASQTCSDEVMRVVGKRLGVSDFRHERDGGVVVSAACKRWPFNGDMIFAFAYGASEPPDFVRHFVVGTIDADVQRVLTIYEAEVIEGPPVQFGEESLRIDTARYQLSTNSRAFGVRFHNIGRVPSCAEGSANDALMLFAPHREQLRFIVGVQMLVQRALSESFCHGAHGVKWEDAGLVFGVEEIGNSGHADIVLTARISTYGWNEAGKELDFSRESRIEIQRLRYAKEGYKVVGTRKWWLVGGWVLGDDGLLKE